MLLLCHLLGQNKEWRDREVRVFHCIGNEAGREQATKHLDELLAAARIVAQPEIVVSDNLSEEIQRHSGKAALVFVGFDPPEEGSEEGFVQGVGQFTAGLRNVVLCSDAGNVSLEA